MYTLSVIILSICLVYISIIMQETEAECAACATTFTSGITNAEQDKGKLCSSAANAYLECAARNCNLDNSDTDARAKAAQQGCGAGSIIVNLAVIGLGLTFYMLV